MSHIPTTLDHVALDVANRDRSAEFYAALLGARPIAEDPEHHITFLRLPGSSRFSDIALHEHPDRDAAYPKGQMRLAHTGWAVDRAQYLVDAFEFFTEHSRVLLAADFGVSLSVMGADPDGNVVEFELFDHSARDAEPGFSVLDLDLLRERVATSSPLVREGSTPR